MLFMFGLDKINSDKYNSVIIINNCKKKNENTKNESYEFRHHKIITYIQYDILTFILIFAKESIYFEL